MIVLQNIQKQLLYWGLKILLQKSLLKELYYLLCTEQLRESYEFYE